MLLILSQSICIQSSVMPQALFDSCSLLPHLLLSGNKYKHNTNTAFPTAFPGKQPYYLALI